MRYSLEKPNEFVDNNIQGFYSLIDVANKYNIKKIIYASSSSIYGDSKRFPLKKIRMLCQKIFMLYQKKSMKKWQRYFPTNMIFLLLD